MKKGYAYLDKYGNMHIVESIKTAREYSANGKIKETEGVDYEYGWPVLEADGRRYSVILKVKEDGKVVEKEGRPFTIYLKELAESLA